MATKTLSEEEKEKNRAYQREYQRKYRKTEKHKQFLEKYKDKKLKYDKEYYSRPEVKEHTKKRLRNAHLKKRYNISIEEYERMYLEQEGKCLICKNFFKTLHVDHNHYNGEIRKLLCGNCNRAIGLLKENISSLKEAIKYLEEN